MRSMSIPCCAEQMTNSEGLLGFIVAEFHNPQNTIHRSHRRTTWRIQDVLQKVTSGIIIERSSAPCSHGDNGNQIAVRLDTVH